MNFSEIPKLIKSKTRMAISSISYHVFRVNPPLRKHEYHVVPKHLQLISHAFFLALDDLSQQHAPLSRLIGLRSGMRVHSVLGKVKSSLPQIVHLGDPVITVSDHFNQLLLPPKEIPLLCLIIILI